MWCRPRDASCFCRQPKPTGRAHPRHPSPGLARALPAAPVLACSVGQARQLVRRLPAADAQCLRTAALRLSRLQRHMPVSRRRRHPLWPEYLPPRRRAAHPVLLRLCMNSPQPFGAFYVLRIACKHSAFPVVVELCGYITIIPTPPTKATPL